MERKGKRWAKGGKKDEEEGNEKFARRDYSAIRTNIHKKKEDLNCFELGSL